MQITGTFLNSKISRRISMLLLIAAIIPATLMTLLSNKKVSELITNYEHQSLVEKSRNYALSTFSNIAFARSRLKDLSKETNASNVDAMQKTSINFSSQKTLIFRSITEVSSNGVILKGDIKKQISKVNLQQLENVDSNKMRLIVLSGDTHNKTSSINLIQRQSSNKSAISFLIAELEPNFLWGDTRDYPSDFNICAYQLSNTLRTKLFCSNEKNISNTPLASSPLNNGAWELFLRGEFGEDPWVFEVNRVVPITQSHLKEFVGSKAYISIAILSLLIIGLLSLIQIRKTMIPLETLVKGTKKIALGDFSQVKVSGSSEFSELADAFNHMSSHIKHQLNTLESFSNIDREIVSKIDVEQVSHLVIERMRLLEPDAIFCIGHLEEKSSSELQCKCTISGHAALSDIRLSMTAKEVDTIKRYNDGRIKQPSLTSAFAHETLMAELGVNHMWVLPIFWQGEICAFLAMGSKKNLDANSKYWPEFRELAGRVAIVISAHAREQKLLLEAQYDNLTGLPNRILLQDRLKIAMEHADRDNNPMWVVFIDLDHFKVVNDSMGHSVGDALLTEIGKRLQAEVRESDTVARFGGDEFVIVLASNVDENIKLNILNRLMTSISAPIKISNHELINTCSMGISTYPNDGTNPETLIKNADIAMYRAKEVGRNNYQFFTQALNDKAAERMEIISLLHKAIENNEFELHYQPKVDLETFAIVGLEALIRWNNPTLGNVAPAKFIPIAEEIGLIATIGEWVLRTACTQLAEWQKSGFGKRLMSVNVSAKQFHLDNFVETIKSVLIETGTKAEYLELELTETLLMNNTTNTLKTLLEIKELGIQLSIDDFGTGYSNLSYLNTLPIDALKIDKSFTDTITSNTKKLPIVDTIIDLAKNLNLKVIAEGVESAYQVEYLIAHACDQIQGYYFSKPLSVEDITKMLVSDKNFKEPKLKLVKAPRKNTRTEK